MPTLIMDESILMPPGQVFEMWSWVGTIWKHHGSNIRNIWLGWVTWGCTDSIYHPWRFGWRKHVQMRKVWWPYFSIFGSQIMYKFLVLQYNLNNLQTDIIGEKGVLHMFEPGSNWAYMKLQISWQLSWRDFRYQYDLALRGVCGCLLKPI